ncbi:MAG: hypothetical protein KatS3mg051_1036 [Anaerolineae bacterium]|nr:MAG: hypothetical protein KatS3mg051_1036 [Anaerolineae bacterium]
MSCSTIETTNERRSRGYLEPTEETAPLWQELVALREKLRQKQGDCISLRAEIGRLTQEIWRRHRERSNQP